MDSYARAARSVVLQVDASKKEEEKATKRINQERFDQISVAHPQTWRWAALLG
jgi:hypothetical protein